MHEFSFTYFLTTPIDTTEGHKKKKIESEIKEQKSAISAKRADKYEGSIHKI